LAIGFLIVLSVRTQAQPAPVAASQEVIIDTDIGDGVDDAFALALALRSPELEILGITTNFGDTETRAKLVDRMLGQLGRQDIPVAVGTPTHTTNVFTQRRYGEGGHFARTSHAAAVGNLPFGHQDLSGAADAD
jgi:hypothetical protein